MSKLSVRTSCLVFAAFFALLCCSAASAQVASGGGYILNRSAIANSGGQSTDPVNNAYRINGTAGQVAAGYGLTGPRYGIISGFWNVVQVPTAAGASITGRVVTLRGAGLRNVVVTIEGGSLTAPRTTLSTTFGYFNFEDLEPGHLYVVTVNSKRYGFATPTQTIPVFGNVTELLFQAGWEN